MDQDKKAASGETKRVPCDFIPSDVAMDFDSNFLDEDTCRRWVIATVYRGQKKACPVCSAPLTEKGLRRFMLGERVRCPGCGKFFTAFTDTFLQGCHLKLSQVILLAVFLHFGIRHEVIALKVGTTPETVRIWQGKFHAIEQMREIKI